jgi:hypothetical protein
MGLLHALPFASGKDGECPRSPEEVIALDLFGTQVEVTDAGLRELIGLKNLATLDLSSAQVTGVGLKELVALKKLTTLVLNETQVTDASLRSLREAGLLHVLSFAEGKDGARPRSPEEVIALDLSNTQVTDVGLKELAALRNLASLALGDTWQMLDRPLVTDAGVAELRQALPMCKISLSE